MYICIWIGGGVDINVKKKKYILRPVKCMMKMTNQKENFAPGHISHNISLARFPRAGGVYR